MYSPFFSFLKEPSACMAIYTLSRFVSPSVLSAPFLAAVIKCWKAFRFILAAVVSTKTHSLPTNFRTPFTCFLPSVCFLIGMRCSGVVNMPKVLYLSNFILTICLEYFLTVSYGWSHTIFSVSLSQVATVSSVVTESILFHPSVVNTSASPLRQV